MGVTALILGKVVIFNKLVLEPLSLLCFVIELLTIRLL